MAEQALASRVPTLGWVQISRQAVDEARRAMEGGGQGVLDEVGFLSLHRGYADRFFPGTSVLHTRLRYVLFIPWLLEDLLAGVHQGRVQEGEKWLLSKLQSAGNGAIGIEVYRANRDLPRQMSHEVYWNALGVWGVLLPRDGQPPRRRAVLTQMRSRRSERDEDATPIDGVPPVVRGLPKRPDGWHAGQLDFRLGSEDERVWLRDRLASARFRGQPTLLSAMVEHNLDVAGIESVFDPALETVAPNSEVGPLARGRQAASAAAVGRAVYAALVERACAEDGRGDNDHFARRLEQVRTTHGERALALDAALVDADVGGLPAPFLELLQRMLDWLGSDRDVGELRAVFAEEEWRKKRGRARLPGSSAARERRAEWEPDAHPDPGPLHYRWSNIRQLLLDLRDAP